MDEKAVLLSKHLCNKQTRTTYLEHDHRSLLPCPTSTSPSDTTNNDHMLPSRPCHPPMIQASLRQPWARRIVTSHAFVVAQRMNNCSKPVFALTSADDRLGHRLIRCIEDLHLLHTPVIPFAVTMVGCSPSLRSTSEALVQLHHGFGTSNSKALPSLQALRAYSRAICLLSKALTGPTGQRGEDLMVTAGMLGLVEYFIEHHAGSVRGGAGLKHWAACSAIMLDQTQLTKLTRATIYSFHGMPTFMQPCWSGRVSPYDSALWLNAEPASPWSTSEPQLDRLRKLAHQLLIRLPRLVCLVRTSRRDATMESWNEAWLLASILSQLRDESAETWLLHRVNVVETNDKQAKRFLKYSYKFRSLAELSAAVHYWESRAIFQTLRSALQTHRLTKVCHGVHGAETAETNSTEDKVRLANNILMAWQEAFAQKPVGTMPMTLGLIAAWAALKDEQEFHGCSISMIAQWIRECVAVSFNGWMVGTTLADLDAAVDVLHGGELTGPMPTLFGYVAPSSAAGKSAVNS